MYSGPRLPSCALTAFQKAMSMSEVANTPKMRMTGTRRQEKARLSLQKRTHIVIPQMTLLEPRSRYGKEGVVPFPHQPRRLVFRDPDPIISSDLMAKRIP